MTNTMTPQMGTTGPVPAPLLSAELLHTIDAYWRASNYLSVGQIYLYDNPLAGHLTIFLTRTRGPFWSIRPARILLIAVGGTQVIATLIAVYGLFMTPLGWGWAGFVWGYALIWFLLSDRVKLLAYAILDPAQDDAGIPGQTPATHPGGSLRQRKA